MSESSSAWAPSHATLYFAVPDTKRDQTDLLQLGSIGGGLNFEEGVETTVQKTFGSDQIYYNGIQIEGKISKTVIQLFRKETAINESVEVYHKSKIKTGCGLSTSGAGSIGLVLALNSLFHTGISRERCLQLAHSAEIICKTGLGSVMGQSVAGIEVRKTIGGPGVGEVLSFPSTSNAIIIILGSLSTSEVLSSPEKMDLVTSTGMKIHEKISGHCTLDEIMEYGKYFSTHCGLMTEKVKTVISDLDNLGETMATMAMIGETVIVIPRNQEQVVKYCKSSGFYYLETKISNRTPYVMS